ncbi:GNAT family N-acetyltransferase [Aquirufa aurantiipilula]|uniref:GNAT family protein n=1 Tax=Aquirufa aurantiipilula TaxID=2696561 RepID=A0ABT6BK38_9BACT|nr:GNAT family protein [Aquirufa aurantiipilula]MDF5690827.1 GNAT family protein [Aquirufa aurantiipilula]
MSKVNIPILETERLKLEPINIEFCSEEYVNWLNDIEVYQYLDNGGDYTYEALQEYLTKYTENPVPFWAIIVKETNTHIGNIKIDPINQRNQIGEYGILMGDKKYWGKGYAKEASIAVINHCFKKLGLRKITLGVIKDNIAAVKLYESLGFEIEGIYRLHGIYAGKYCDALRMAIFDIEKATNEVKLK